MTMTTTIPISRTDTNTERSEEGRKVEWEAYAPPRYSAFVVIYGALTSLSGLIVGVLLGWLFWGMH
jgi:hypothetical protein